MRLSIFGRPSSVASWFRLVATKRFASRDGALVTALNLADPDHGNRFHNDLTRRCRRPDTALDSERPSMGRYLDIPPERLTSATAESDRRLVQAFLAVSG